ncbi:hypothetical protein N7520_008597 [Penicillium odoratum]|uniref:uncharacterized protein n=1 Tax=Penicillium odoratum TaxID=1167516 RepID=UPI0025487EDD|nr:uncharacterized protein N7520_008597 [Penicillium odoratum]KAJ5751680.1 hypothetical protein N7520_008597 [Penicillium odoratum]
MAPFMISQCSVPDGAALAANNVPAFWADPHWVLAWRHRTLEYHISQVALLFPRNMLNERESFRHQKAVNLETGRILGYARWSLYVPSCHEINPDNGTPIWPEAQVPAFEPEKEAEIRWIAETAIWDPNEDADELGNRVTALRTEVTPKTPHISLKYLAVHPDNQRKGVGTALVKSGTDQADKMGLDIIGVSGEYGADFFIYEAGSRTVSTCT